MKQAFNPRKELGNNRPNGKLPNMTIVEMGTNGRIVLPRRLREQRGYDRGSIFALQETKSGRLILQPLDRKPKRTLLEHLMRFKGIQIPERKHFSRPRA